MNCQEIIDTIKENSNPENVKGMARFGINPEKNYGISVTNLRKIAKKIEKNHNLALKLWETKIRDARFIAAFIDKPEWITEEQMENWVNDFNSWDLCDNTCGNLFDKTKFSYKKAKEWSKRKEEFVKRAGFAMIAWLAVHDKNSDDKKFEELFDLIINESKDERNYVKKAVNWALRNIGKRNKNLNKKAIKISEKIKKIDNKTAKWIANDALRELTSKKVQNRFEK